MDKERRNAARWTAYDVTYQVWMMDILDSVPRVGYRVPVGGEVSAADSARRARITVSERIMFILDPKRSVAMGQGPH